MSDDMSAYKDVFLSESAEYVQQIVDGLLALEKDPADRDSIETVFRGAHSLKGMAAAMGYQRTTEMTHKMESLMDTVRKGERPADSPLVDVMLRAVDVLGTLIDEESEGGASVDIMDIVADLVSMIQEAAEGRSIVDLAASGGADGEKAHEPARSAVYRVNVTLEESCVLKSVRAYMVIKRLAHAGTVVDTHPSGREIEDEQFDRSFQVTVETTQGAEDLVKAILAVSEVEKADAERVEARPTDVLDERVERRAGVQLPKLSETQTVRVSIGHLDSLVNLVGELVILRSRLDRLASTYDLRELTETVEELHSVSSELQHEVMQTRMVPVGNIFNRFPRMVRDLARDLAKEVSFEMDGLDIELDRTVLDEIGDPIVHLLRNSVDHGIESPEDREAAGKPRAGHLWLTAMRERDHVRIVVTDDGAGIDVERIWDKACTMGLVEPARRDEYGDTEIMLLTCSSGFSTADEVTKLSGRGVGMDVVKGKVEYLGGHLTISSTIGKGTEISLVLPLTLAIIPALMVSTRGETFALPLSAVEEVLPPDEIGMDTVDGVPVVILRDGGVVALHPLDALIGGAGDAHRMPEQGDHVVLVTVQGATRALLVERLLGRQEVVMKPLSTLFRSIRGLAGATVLGDGRVALILDPRTLFPGREEVA